MNSVRNLAVDFDTRTITVSPRFLQQSRVYDSHEFNTLLRLTKELPGFEIHVRRVSRTTHRPYMPSYWYIIPLEPQHVHSWKYHFE